MSPNCRIYWSPKDLVRLRLLFRRITPFTSLILAFGYTFRRSCSLSLPGLWSTVSKKRVLKPRRVFESPTFATYALDRCLSKKSRVTVDPIAVKLEF